VKGIIKKFGRKVGLDIRKYSPNFYENEVVSLKPENEFKGSVLLSYIINPFLLKDGETVSNSHTHEWESLQIAKAFSLLGYAVDVIDYRNKTFIPKKDYSIFVAARTNFQRIAENLKKDCLKIVHLDTAHWLFNNSSAYQRCLELQKRRCITLENFKWVEPNWAIEHADYATILGNQFTIETYRYVHKKIYRIPISACVTYPWTEDKNYEVCRYHFLWLGSDGLVHKGLDLVLEAFAEMPDYHLYVCGPINQERDFKKAYYKELYQTPNIHTIGWVDVDSSLFVEVAKKCIGIVYPSCSEGGGGSVIQCIHAGLIPIVSYESSVDVEDFGMILDNCSIGEIQLSVKRVSEFPVQKLKAMSQKAWEFARVHHTRENFAKEYRAVIENIMNDWMNRNISSDQAGGCAEG